MDVLDHTCSKLGFGGKMCIDGTFKFEEEKDDNYEWRMENGEWKMENGDPVAVGWSNVKELFKEIRSINISLLKMEIPCVIISLEKSRKNHVRELHKAICALEEIREIKMILYVEHTVDANDLTTALWRFCNNVDPQRDYILYKADLTTPEAKDDSQTSYIVPRTSNIKYMACMGFDGTRKTKEFDNFQRDWPNIIVASDETIKAVDDKWEALGIGEFIPSPSLKFKAQMYGEEAVVGVIV